MNLEILIVIALGMLLATNLAGVIIVGRYVTQKMKRQRPGYMQSVGLEDMTAQGMKVMAYNQLQWDELMKRAKDLRNGRYDEDEPNATAVIEKKLEAIQKILESE